MLNLKQGLLYPNLVYFQNDTHPDPRETNSLFKLDWSKKEYAYHEAPVSSEDQDFLTALPKGYDGWIRDMVFSLNQEYLREIEHCTKMSHYEWTRNRSFDTIIRDACLEPAASYIWTAFYLLADCVWSLEANKFYNWSNSDKILIAHALAYKFWRNQIGHGLVKDHAKIPRLEETQKILIAYRPVTENTLETIQEISYFLIAIEQHETKIYEAHAKRVSGDETPSSVHEPTVQVRPGKARGSSRSDSSRGAGVGADKRGKRH